MKIKRVGLTNMATRGTGATLTISNHPGGFCDTALVFIRRNINPVSPDGVTYGGDAMTKLVDRADANNNNHSIWGLRGCKTGSQNVVISQGTGYEIQAGVVTIRGVDPRSDFPNVSGSDGGSPVSSVTVSVTTTKDNCVLFGIGGYTGNAASNVFEGTGTNQFSTWIDQGRSEGMDESDPLNTGVAGSKSMQVAAGNTADMCLVVVALAPNTSTPNFFKYL